MATSPTCTAAWVRIDQTLELEEIIQAVCQLYRITEKQLIAKGKERKLSEARSVIAWIVRGSENPTLEVWEERCGRDGVTLSNAIRILPERAKTGKDLLNKMKEIEEKRLISFGSIPATARRTVAALKKR